MPFDHSKLIGRIAEKFKTRRAFCAAIGMSESVLNSRLNNNTSFDADEIKRICAPDILDIPDAEVVAYFFSPKFDKIEQ